MEIVKNKKYYVKQLNSSKANKMTAQYHYSGVGFKKSILNLGVYRNEDRKLVGVLQWGCSFQDGIRLDRYVKEPVTNAEYLELNRFSMADSEEKNSESQAISLGIKWIKRFRPNIKLLVSYAGRKEGNYGYIYQATNWEYLGYFVSEGFWFVDGEERHMVTLWSRYKKYANPELGFIDGICDMYEDVRKTWTKQFIYIMRLDQDLTPSSDLLPYPKPATEHPIKTREHIYKLNEEVFNAYAPIDAEKIEYYDEGEERLFTRAALLRRGEVIPEIHKPIAIYDAGGELIKTYKNIYEIPEEYKRAGIRTSLKDCVPYKSIYFQYYIDEPVEQIDVPYECLIDEIPFNIIAEAARYVGVSRQGMFAAKKRRAKKVNGYDIRWFDNL